MDVCTLKLLTVVINAGVWQASVFVASNHFYPRLIFAGKSGAHRSRGVQVGSKNEFFSFSD